ncbi:hypothetical protein [Streptomyces sp. NPDC015414]
MTGALEAEHEERPRADLLGWTPKLSLEDGIRSAPDWMPVRDEL